MLLSNEKVRGRQGRVDKNWIPNFKTVILVLGLWLVRSQSCAAEQLNPHASVISIPAQTKFRVLMSAPLNTDTVQEGDKFLAKTSEDLSVDGVVALPANCLVEGVISNVKRNRYVSTPTQLKINSVTVPEGLSIPLVANIVNHGGMARLRRGHMEIAFQASRPYPGCFIGAVPENLRLQDFNVTNLSAKRNQHIDLQVGDELTIELAEELRVPAF